jgi:hypothetical protein
VGRRSQTMGPRRAAAALRGRGLRGRPGRPGRPPDAQFGRVGRTVVLRRFDDSSRAARSRTCPDHHTDANPARCTLPLRPAADRRPGHPLVGIAVDARRLRGRSAAAAVRRAPRRLDARPDARVERSALAGHRARGARLSMPMLSTERPRRPPRSTQLCTCVGGGALPKHNVRAVV